MGTNFRRIEAYGNRDLIRSFLIAKTADTQILKILLLKIIKSFIFSDNNYISRTVGSL